MASKSFGLGAAWVGHGGAGSCCNRVGWRSFPALVVTDWGRKWGKGGKLACAGVCVKHVDDENQSPPTASALLPPPSRLSRSRALEESKKCGRDSSSLPSTSQAHCFPSSVY
ncbi:arogenate dehydratase/prephenate dehydratase 2, chloroplastic [Canna indica]|uniref:Arogenate dehydratase/prephenate dehydratase 2, chloroplastic n=1 Tax=Canna indica TaxID=4628 RepID=A0AAQ3KF90_9LILI|nr:arogenate dehydratase/prephenate dehydratase 2, chloroplastic [Canna indica]